MIKVKIEKVEGGYILNFSGIAPNLEEFGKLTKMDSFSEYTTRLRLMANMAGSSDKKVVCQNFEETVKKLKELFGEP